eukprot:8427910-Alexandrium_andersonii.AAC.1
MAEVDQLRVVLGPGRYHVDDVDLHHVRQHGRNRKGDHEGRASLRGAALCVHQAVQQGHRRQPRLM